MAQAAREPRTRGGRRGSGTTCYGAAHEYLFNVSYHRRKAGLKKQVKVTDVTSEPFIGHFGGGGLPLGKTLLGTLLRRNESTPSPTLR